MKLGFDSAFTVDREGRSSGLAMLWRNSFHCTVTSYATNYINTEIVKEDGFRWRCTGYYIKT